MSQLEDRLNHIRVTYSEIESLLERIHQLDAEYNNLLPELPKRYQPTDTQLDRLDKYAVELENFNAVTYPQKLCLIRKAQEILEIQDLKKDFSKRIAKYRAELEKKIYNHKDNLINSLKDLKSEYENRSENLLYDFNQYTADINAQINSKEKISLYSSLLESKYENLLERAEQTIFPIVRHIKTLNFDVDEELVQGVYRMEYENMKAQWEQVRETAQLGIAVEIIDHEFNQIYAKINHSLKLLKSDNIFANSSEFEYLIKNFKQLETKYELLSPLYRISGAIPKLISGEMIYTYLKKFFENSFKDINIELLATEAFLQHAINIKEPVIHTVFINIVNNAVYWLKNSSSKVIKLDYINSTNEFLIANSGQRIEEHRLDKIFQLFYSNRPNGRGIGLYLVKQVLMESRYDIYATNDKQYNSLGGACFVIKLKS